MSVRLRLQRHGSKKRPFYRIVAADQRAPRDGRSKEVLGTFDPMHEPNVVDLRVDRVDYWLGVGAQPTETVSALIRKVREGGHFITSAEFEERNRTARRDRQAAALAAKEVVTAKAEAPAAPARGRGGSGRRGSGRRSSRRGTGRGRGCRRRGARRRGCC